MTWQDVLSRLTDYGPVGVATAVVLHVVAMWFRYRASQRVRYKTPTVEVEAPTAAEVERLVRLAIHQDQSE